MAATDDFSDFSDFDFDFNFDMLGKNMDLPGESNVNLSVGDVDLFGEPFALPLSEDQPSNLSSDVSASPAGASPKNGQSSVETLTVSPQVLECSQAANSPKSAQASPSRQSPLPQPPQSRLPPGRDFTPVPKHILVRRCSPPLSTNSPSSSMRPQVRVHRSVAGSPQRTKFVSPSTPILGYTNMRPPPPGPLNERRYAPLAPIATSPSGAVTPNPSRKRKADADSELATNTLRSVDGSQISPAFDETGKKPLAKKRRLEQSEQEMRQLMDDGQKLAHGSTEGQAMEVDLKTKQDEALGQAMEYRRLRSKALEEAMEYKRLGTNALQRYSYYKEEHRKLRG